MKSIKLTIAMIFLTVAVMAQPHHFHRTKGKMKSKNPELFKALQEYHKTKVYPVMKEKKAELEKSLDRKQRKALKKLRKKSENLRAESKALKQKAKAEYEAGKDKSELKETYKERFQAQKKKHEELQKEVLVWITTNETEVNSVMEVLKPLHQEWRAEKKAIFQEHRPENVSKNDDEKARHHKGKKGEGKYHGKKHGKHHKGKHGSDISREDMAKVKFVLWNGELPEEKVETVEKTTEIEKQQAIDFSVYPNPAKEMTTVKYELTTDAKSVELLITNLSGQVVKKLTYNDLAKGTQEVQVDISNLEKGQYFYTIVADGVKKTEKIIVE